MPRKKIVEDDEMQSSSKLGREFLSAISQIADEKGISKEKVIETIEAALSAAYKKDYGKKGQNIRAEFDEVSGDSKFFLVKEVVDETVRDFPKEKEEGEEEDGDESAFAEASADEEEKLPRYNPERDVTVEEAKKIKKSAKVGDIIETELEPKNEYGRVAAQTAKQVIIQRIREAERDAMFSEYKEKEGQVVNATIQRIEGRTIFVELGKSTGVLFPSGQVETDRYRIGQRLKVYIEKVESDPKGPGITLSRSNPEMIRQLFALEVPEIFAGTVEIKAVAREAGSRTKIAVMSKEDGVDPIGSCVGQKGTRVQTVIDELGGEKIDIIEWNDNAEKFISAALSPAKVLSVTLNEEENVALVMVPDDQLSLAIGKRGQNVRLAAKLTGWRIDVVGNKPEDKEVEEVANEDEAATEESVGNEEE